MLQNEPIELNVILKVQEHQSFEAPMAEVHHNGIRANWNDTDRHFLNHSVVNRKLLGIY